MGAAQARPSDVEHPIRGYYIVNQGGSSVVPVVAKRLLMERLRGDELLVLYKVSVSGLPVLGHIDYQNQTEEHQHWKTLVRRLYTDSQTLSVTDIAEPEIHAPENPEDWLSKKARLTVWWSVIARILATKYNVHVEAMGLQGQIGKRYVDRLSFSSPKAEKLERRLRDQLEIWSAVATVGLPVLRTDDYTRQTNEYLHWVRLVNWLCFRVLLMVPSPLHNGHRWLLWGYGDFKEHLSTTYNVEVEQMVPMPRMGYDVEINHNVSIPMKTPKHQKSHVYLYGNPSRQYRIR